MVQLPSAPSDSGNSRSTSLLRDLQHHAGLAGHGVRRRVDVADLIHPPHRDHHLAVMRGLAADEASVAALRHQRDSVLGRKPADRGDLGGRARPQHQRRSSVKQVALLGEVRRDVGGIGDRVFVADNFAETRDQFGRERRACGLQDIHHRLLMVSCRFTTCTFTQSRPTAARRSRSLIASPSP
jgi:hypothetical protein